MKRSQSSFVCQECGYESAQWLGKCPQCLEWNSLREIVTSVSKSKDRGLEQVKLSPKKLTEINNTENQRLLSGFSEMDTVLGGGLVLGSVTLLAGDPGIGKSTLLLQVALKIADGSSEFNEPLTVLYISGEESEEQIKLRTNRIAKAHSVKNLLLLSATNTDAIADIIRKTKPAFVIIDSIQTMESVNLSGLSGSVGQVRYAALTFLQVAKSLGIAMILVGHVTKEGMVAGPMILSHMVDTLLFLEGEKTTGTRILRSFKNRFGPVDEVGIFVMNERGMSQVESPQGLFLDKKNADVAGSVLTATLEGTRTFLVEIQALVVFSKLPIPRRIALGIDPKRLELMLAVLQKHVGLSLWGMDVFVNAAGGIKLSDPAADLGICLAIFSSLKNIHLGKTVAVSEVGLLGELRKVPFLDKRIKEAKKLGFVNVISSEKYRFLSEAMKAYG